MGLEKLIQEVKELQKQISESNMCRKEILPLNDAAIYLGISRSTLYKINSVKGISFSKPAHKIIYYRRLDLDAWMLKNQTTAVDNSGHVKPRKRRQVEL